MHLDDWKSQIRQSFTSLADLKTHHLISEAEASRLEKVTHQYQIRITPYYAQLLENSPLCPIRLQAIPQLGEEDPLLPEWATQWSQRIYGRPTPWHPDPIGDLQYQVTPRLTHRYVNRAILHLSSVCAVYCRFCFRKSHLNDSETTLYEGTLKPALDYLSAHPEIAELILTGGDPLSVTDPVLENLFDRIQEISSIRVLRIHSRMPVTLPHRFTPSLLELFAKERGFRIYLVSHFNHPRELTPLAREKLQALTRSGVTLLNQSVLMRGVNASSEILAHLFQELYESGVIPYYLHHADWTPGTFQFRTSIEEGIQIMQTLRGKISGPTLPHYVLDLPGGLGKVSLMEQTLKKQMELPVSHASDPDPRIQGTIYEWKSPSTRTFPSQVVQYLDLSYCPQALSLTRSPESALIRFQ